MNAFQQIISLCKQQSNSSYAITFYRSPGMIDNEGTNCDKRNWALFNKIHLRDSDQS